MEKIYKYENAIIHVTSTKSCDREELKKITEEFLKKAIYGGKKNGNIDKTRDLNEK